MSLLTIFSDQVQDTRARESLQNIRDFINKNPFMTGDFKIYTINVKITDASTHFSFPHDLGYTPSDVLVTSVKGSGTITWNYDAFTSQVLDLTVAGGSVGQTVTIRVLAGKLS